MHRQRVKDLGQILDAVLECRAAAIENSKLLN
jgi:hypothetical protein